LQAGLHRVLGALSKDLATQLSALVNAQFGGKQHSREVFEKAVAERVPVLVEQSFFTNFLSDKEVAREHRALLSHVLSTAELQATVGIDWVVCAPKSKDASKAVGSADDADEWLTSEAASKLLHVSRTHLNTLADSGELGDIRRTHGRHRRISKVKLLQYKERTQERQSKGLDAMVTASQKLGLYNAEFEGLPVKAGD
jgi:excisionase family DNA binding protein